MKFLSSLVLLLISQVSFGSTITNVAADWTTYRVDLEAGSNYSIFGGGSAGDVFHIFFEFNRAYLPYINQVNSEMQSTDFAMHTSAAGIADTSTAAVDDYLHFDALPLLGSLLRFEINGTVYNTPSPFALTFLNGAISGISTGLFGAINFMFMSPGNFILTDAQFTSNLEGRLCGIVDTQTTSGNACQVDVPEPGILLLLLTGLAGFAFRRGVRKSAC